MGPAWGRVLEQALVAPLLASCGSAPIRVFYINVLTRYYIHAAMKQRSTEELEARAAAERSLCEALLSLRSVEEMQAFLRDLCTPAELEAMGDRWRVVPFLLEGVPYRDIHAATGVSITTTGRVARFLTQGNGGYRVAAERRAAGQGTRKGPGR